MEKVQTRTTSKIMEQFSHVLYLFSDGLGFQCFQSVDTKDSTYMLEKCPLLLFKCLTSFWNLKAVVYLVAFHGVHSLIAFKIDYKNSFGA